MNSLPVNQRDSISKLTATATKGSVGLPVGVQVMTPMWEDENCLFVMAEIERAVEFNTLPPDCD